MARYTEQAEACAGGSSYECGRALSHYAREISNDDLGPVISMLRENCNSDRVTGCEALASAYGSHENRSAAGTITVGIDDAALRMATLRLGCSDLMAPGNTCDGLGDALAKLGDITAASVAYNKSCTYIMDLGHNQVGYDGHWDCYNAAKHALLVAKDYATATHSFIFVCDSDTAGLAPFACKYLGRIHDRGLGVERDAKTAHNYFGQSCFHRRVDDSDGEGCLLYGELLIRDREAIAVRDRDLEGAALPQSADAASMQYILEDASRAFQRGCKSRIPLACAANKDLLAQRIDGAFGFETIECFVRDMGDPEFRVQTCRTLKQFPNFNDPDTQADPLREAIFIWPDGDRTIVQQSGDVWRLNGNRTSGLVAGPSYDCIANPATGREFCAHLMRQ
jgi:TPR repeat protein